MDRVCKVLILLEWVGMARFPSPSIVESLGIYRANSISIGMWELGLAGA